jgi:Rad3-related DNA helicase
MIKIDEELSIYYPLKFKPRPQQIEIFNLVKKSINNGKKFILLNSPTGSGKSYFAMMFMNWYRNYCNQNSPKFDIITNSKILQQQYKDEFDFIDDLRGQSNYKCMRHHTDCRSGKELNKTSKLMPCGGCPYDEAKRNWVGGSVSLTNFHLYNSFAFFVPTTLLERGANVLIVDESHLLEEVFCDFISVKLSPRILKNYGMEQQVIDMYHRKFTDIKTAGGFINFITRDFIPYIAELKQGFEDSLADAPSEKLKQIYIGFITYIKSAEEKFNGLLKDFEKNEYNWTLDITKSKTNEVELNMQPIWGNVYLDDVIWSKYDHVIFMSGTLLNKKIFSNIVGIDPSISDYHDINSIFPVKNRKIYYIDCGKMNYSDKKETFQKQIPVIEKILRKYKNDKGIIHTTNYEISNWLKENLKDKRLIFHNSDDRGEMLSKHLKNKKSSVIVSPSMINGLDLNEDLSRFQIILKMPFPNLGSNKIKARKDSNPESYKIKTCQDLIQSYGRSIRSETDHADTFILDSNFNDLLRYGSKYFPKWFMEAIVYVK